MVLAAFANFEHNKCGYRQENVGLETVDLLLEGWIVILESLYIVAERDQLLKFILIDELVFSLFPG